MLGVCPTVLLILIPLITSQDVTNSTWWPCQPLLPQKDVDLTKVVGEWYLVEVISSLPGISQGVCAGIHLAQSSSTSERSNLTFKMVGFTMVEGQDVYYDNNTVIITNATSYPALWELPDIGAAAVVTHLNTSSFALTTCHSFLTYEWTGVFSRNLPVDPTVLERINAQLVSTGLNNVSTATVLNTTSCPTVPMPTAGN